MLIDKTTILIPMAGKGERFTKEGYKSPKPLINVSGKPMVTRAIESLPEGHKYLFICQSSHLKDNNLIKYFKNNFTNYDIIDIDYLTQGQASTCYLAKDFVNQSYPLIIGACDNGMIWNKIKFNKLIENNDVDAIIWTFRNHETVNINPDMYGWVLLSDSGIAQNISCKKSISKKPVFDHAIVGTFWFRKAKHFFDNAERMIKSNRRVNGEFYVDEVMNLLIEDGLQVKVFEIDKYLCWGTPNDLKTYEYWRVFFEEHY